MTKRTTFLLAALATLFITISVASAVPQKDVAYISKGSINGNIIVSLNQLGLTYDIIPEDSIPTTNFENYYILLVAENVKHKEQLPFSSKHAIFLDKTVAEVVWQGTTTQSSSNQRQIKVAIPSHKIFEGMTIPLDGVITVYGGAGSLAHYLIGKPGYVTPLAIRTTGSNSIIAYSERNIGGYPVRDVFFGLVNPSEWNANAQQMFRNSLTFLRADVDQDQDGYIFEQDCNDTNPFIHPGAPEIPYDHIDQDCDGYDLIDQDNDGFCKSGYIIQNPLFQCIFETGLVGTDCADDNPSINPHHPDKSINCINDAPEFTSVPQDLQVREGERIEFQVTATDPEGDRLTYSISHPGFTVNESTFSWQTGYTDAGTYLLRINVTDGQFHVETTTTLNVIDADAPPISISIPPIVWPEEGQTWIDLSNYFTDPDSSVMGFGIETFPNESKIFVDFDGDKIVVFTSAKDFFGEDTIIFFAEDGNSKTLSNVVTLSVTNVNDPVIFNGTIPDIELDEDIPKINAINLLDYFTDIDSVLQFSAVGIENVTVEFTNSTASFYPDKDYFGTQEIYLTATDGEFSAVSNTFTLTVHEQGEPPEFYPLTCTTQLVEDTTYSCTLSAWDFENDTFIFSVAEENNLLCNVEGDTLVYKSAPDYFGNASCVLKVSDVHGYTQTTLAVSISPVNDAPRIESYDPQTDVVRVVAGWNKTFSINALDVDSPAIWTTWRFASQEVSNSTQNFSSYTLVNPPIGNYLIEAIVRDTELQTRKFWNVVVGPIEDFTCSEVGGHVCSGGTMCGVETLGVNDAKICCPVACIPSFDDADACRMISKDINIKLNDFNRDLELGDDIKVDFVIINNLNKDQKFDVEVHLYNLDRDRSEEFVKTTAELGRGRSRTVRVNLPIPNDLDLEEDDFVVLVIVEDDECGQDYRAININRQRDSVLISDLDIPQSAICGESIVAEVAVENIGSRGQAVNLSLNSSDLKIDKSMTFDLEKYSSNSDRETKSFIIALPDNLESGEYEITARVSYAQNLFRTVTKKIDIECLKEEVRASTTVPEIITNEKITLNQIRELQPLPVKSAKKPNYLPIAVIGTMNVLLIGSAVILYTAYKKKQHTP